MSEHGWKTRAGTGMTVIFGIAAVIFVGVLGVWIYVSATATPLHPKAEDVPSVAVAAPAPAWAAAVEQGRRVARAALAERNLPGLSVAVASGGDIVWAEGFGFADLEKKTKVTPATEFRLGTASMAITSAALGLLAEKGKLHLDDDLQSYVPEFPKKEWPVTLRQLMAQTGGVRSDGGDEGPFRSGVRCEKPVEGLQFFAKDPLLFEPGTKFRMSIYGWILLSAAVESAADGEPFLSFMQKQVFAPLRMDHTRAEPARDASPDRATSYFPRFGSEPRYGPDLTDPFDYSCYAGAAVFLSTPSDLVRFAAAINAGTLLKPATVHELQTSQTLTTGSETGYGLGWDLDTATLAGQPTPLVGHDGSSMGGMVASFMTFPEYGLVVAVTSNISYSGTHALAVQIAEAFAAHGKRLARR